MMAITRRAFVTSALATIIVSSVEAAPRGGSFRLRGVVRSSASGLVPAGTLRIRLEEQGIMDMPATRIASATVRSSGRRRAVAFEMIVSRNRLNAAVDPGFSVRLERNDRLIAINTSKQRYDGRREVSLRIEPILY